jgi:hypothetical protein
MNYIHFLHLNKTQGFIITLFILCAQVSFAQSEVTPHANSTQILSQKELDAINNAPIAPKAYASDRTSKSGRQTTFDSGNENGTQIKEYQDIGQNKEIQVNTALGTHYQMSPTSDKDNTSSPMTLNRVPSIQLPF